MWSLAFYVLVFLSAAVRPPLHVEAEQGFPRSDAVAICAFLGLVLIVGFVPTKHGPLPHSSFELRVGDDYRERIEPTLK